MKYTRLGKTDLQVSRLGIGAIKFGDIEQDAATEIVRKAYEDGINFIDTARCYGASEERIGTALAELGLRDKFIITSKIIRRPLAKIQKDFEITLKNLRTDYLDILMIHDLSTPQTWNTLKEEGGLDYFLSLKESGRVKHLGISTHDVAIGTEALKTGLFEVAMVAYNPTSLEVEDTLLPLCRQMDIGTVIMKPYGGGVLTHDRSRQLGFAIEAEDCLRFLFSNEDVNCVIPGIEQLSYLDTALKTEAEDPHWTKAEREALSAGIDMKVKNYCRGCGYCMPCPQGILIPKTLSLLNRWQVVDDVDWSRMHNISLEYTELLKEAKGPDACIGCGLCQTKCPFNLPVSELMKEATERLIKF